MAKKTCVVKLQIEQGRSQKLDRRQAAAAMATRFREFRLAHRAGKPCL